MEESGQADTSMTNVTLPTYLPGVQAWFQQTILLMLRVKSQRIKVGNWMKKLPPDVTSRIADLTVLPKQNPYDYLKIMILKRTGRSDEERIIDVLQNVTRGDRTPAQLLRNMKSQLGSKNGSKTVLRLPPSVTQIIAPTSRATTLDDLLIPLIWCLRIPPTTSTRYRHQYRWIHNRQTKLKPWRKWWPIFRNNWMRWRSLNDRAQRAGRPVDVLIGPATKVQVFVNFLNSLNICTSAVRHYIW